MANENRLPKLAELHAEPEEAFIFDEYLTLVNQPPHIKWIKKHPLYGNKYLPIDKVEYMLKRIFQKYRVEILQVGSMFNSCYVTVRLHYLLPSIKLPNGSSVPQEWTYHDGVGAKAMQLESGAKASDLTQIKAEALMIALPSAKSLAIKDACDHIGKLFGGDLNRKDTLRFKGGYTITDKEEVEEDEKKEIISTNNNGQSEDLPL